MNKNVENLLKSIQVPTEINYDEDECNFRKKIAQNAQFHRASPLSDIVSYICRKCQDYYDFSAAPAAG